LPRLLLVTYHFPPAGGAGTLRALRFARYLRGFGWETEVVCADPLPAVTRDPSLQRAVPPDVPVHFVRSFEPGRFSDSWEQPLQKIVRNLFRTFDFMLVPDEHVGWVRPALSLCSHLRSRTGGFDAVLTTGPPFSTHLIGLGLRERFGLPWVADFRDDWTGFNDAFRGGAMRRRPSYERRLEADVLRQASVVLTVNESLQAAIRARREGVEVEVIPNGFDPADFETTSPQRRPAGPFVIRHLGSLYEQRSPAVFLEGLRRLGGSERLRGRLEARFLGRVVGPVPDLLAAPDLGDVVCYDGIQPHAESIRAMCESDALLLIIDQVQQAEQIWTGKVFEYLGARRPILGLMPPEGQLARLLRESSDQHRIVPTGDAGAVAAALESMLDASFHASLPESSVLAQFRADALTQQLARLLERCVESDGALRRQGHPRLAAKGREQQPARVGVARALDEPLHRAPHQT